MHKRPQKHSLTLNGHRTSVSLEAEFWRSFCEISKAKSISINALAAEIDVKRKMEIGLASAIRLYILNWYKNPRP